MDKLLKEEGLKVTRARLQVLDILSKEKYPIDMENIFHKIKKKGVNLATLYRIMFLFEEKSLVQKVDLKKGMAFFELKQKHHHHIICKQCDKIEDFENKEIEKILKNISRNSLKFKKITDHSLELFGLCKVCS
mgnify:FL=1